jgi:hypothetical protein
MIANIDRVFGLVQRVLGISQTQALAPNGVTGQPLGARMGDDVGP